MPIFATPDLPTFHQPPSWCNKEGRIDRSACLEVRLSEIRRLAGCVRSIPSKTRKRLVPLKVQPLPNEKRAINKHGRVATGIFTITAHQVNDLNRQRMPRQLAGDWRTTRAHAMRNEHFKPDKGFRFRQPRNADPIDAPFDLGLDPNPNHGASRSKVINLDHAWMQPLRLEKWIFKNRIQPAYYLICPSMCSVNRTPGLSTCPRGRNSAKHGCPQRALKLMMVQCTQAERRDAQLAQRWINSLPTQLIPRFRQCITALLQRYGPIMPPRMLVCPRCLGVRYGNNPENARQAWRRKVGKKNARPAKRKVAKSNNAQWVQKTKRRERNANDETQMMP